MASPEEIGTDAEDDSRALMALCCAAETSAEVRPPHQVNERPVISDRRPLTRIPPAKTLFLQKNEEDSNTPHEAFVFVDRT